MYIYIYITGCILWIDCLLIAFDAHMFSHNGYWPGTTAQSQKLRASRPRPSG